MTSKRFLNVQYGLKPTRVNTTEMEDISEVVTAIKTYFGDDIQGPAARIQLWKKNDTENILIEDLDDIPNEYYLKPKNGGLSLAIVLLPSPTPSHQASEISLEKDNNRKSSRLLTTRKMSVEASCQKYLDAIAKRLTEFYEFDYRFKGGATIGDILEAKDGVEGEDWKFRRAVKTHYQTDDDGFTVEIRKGQPLTNNHLPDLYTPDEWDKISKFNKKTTKRVHDGQLPHLSNGKPYIIIPHSEFTVEMISFLKNIDVKATLFSSPDDLEVKDEDFLSDSSFIV
ncbi:hypothetical protein BC833DRAFT_597501 [Globomyces pollinis-pini]|nr:hypothetical protein BC833DRAFT_597501 [Globomyces pollinis-pini]